MINKLPTSSTNKISHNYARKGTVQVTGNFSTLAAHNVAETCTSCIAHRLWTAVAYWLEL